jgi:AI-2 transport protein TqsA
MLKPSPEQRIQTACLLTLTAVALAAALYWLQPVVVPFVFALFLAATLSPIVHFLTRSARIPHVVSVVIALLAVFIIVLVLGGFISVSIGQFAGNVGSYQQQFQKLVNDTAEGLPLEQFGVDPETDIDLFSILPSGSVEGILRSLTGTIMGLLSKGLLVMLFALFILLGNPGTDEPRTGTVASIEARIKRYITTKVFLSIITGALVYATLALLGVRYAVTFGAFSFLLNFIPNIGSIVATLLPLPVVLLTPELSTTGQILAIAVPGAIQFTIGSVIEPKVMGISLDLHPAVVLLSLIFWGVLWGFEGMVLAVPITAVLRMSLERIESTAPIAALLAGRLDGFEKRDDEESG